MKNSIKKPKPPKEPKPCKYCKEPCDSQVEVVGMQLSTGDTWHVRCVPSRREA